MPWLNINAGFVNGKKYGGDFSRIGADIHNLAFLYHEYIVAYIVSRVKLFKKTPGCFQSGGVPFLSFFQSSFLENFYGGGKLFVAGAGFVGSFFYVHIGGYADLMNSGFVRRERIRYR